MADYYGSIVRDQNLAGDGRAGSEAARAAAFAYIAEKGYYGSKAQSSILRQAIGANNYSQDTAVAENTATETVANNEGDAANGATVVKNPIQPSWYGTDVSYPKDETSEEVSTVLGGAARVLSQADAKVGPNGSPPTGALDSFYNREVVPTPTYAEGAAGQTVADDLDAEVIDNPGGHAMSSPGQPRAGSAGTGQPRAGIAVTSGGMYSGYGFNHYYGRNRSNTQPRGDDGITSPKRTIDDYLAAMYGAIPGPAASMQPRGDSGDDKIDNPGGHSRSGPGQPRQAQLQPR